MAIVNKLRSEWQELFATFNSESTRNTQNQAGGVGLWDVPPAFGAVFNPLIFKRTQYYFVAGNYAPAILPIYFGVAAGVASTTFVFNQILPEAVTIHFANEDGVGRATVAAGNERVIVQATGLEVLGVSLQADQAPQPYVKTANAYYAESGTLIDDGQIVAISPNNVLYLNTEVADITLDVFNANSKADRYIEAATLTASSYKGVAMFDVAPIVRSWIEPNLAEVEIEAGVVADRALFANYYVFGVAGSSVQSNFTAVNAVVQIGENPDLAGYVGKVLTTKPRLEFFNGYPLDYSVLSGADGTMTANGQADPNSVTRCAILAILTDENNVPILTEAGEYIYLIPEVDIEVVERCVPSSPFYLRWINDLGGVDYWMFQKYQQRTIGVGSTERASSYVANPYTANGNEHTLLLTAEDSIHVGAGNLSKGDFEALSKMPFSRLIEWWRPDTQKWVRLNVESYSLQTPLHSGVYQFDVELSLPKRYTQMEVW